MAQWRWPPPVSTHYFLRFDYFSMLFQVDMPGSHDDGPVSHDVSRDNFIWVSLTNLVRSITVLQTRRLPFGASFLRGRDPYPD